MISVFTEFSLALKVFSCCVSWALREVTCWDNCSTTAFRGSPSSPLFCLLAGDIDTFTISISTETMTRRNWQSLRDILNVILLQAQCFSRDFLGSTPGINIARTVLFDRFIHVRTQALAKPCLACRLCAPLASVLKGACYRRFEVNK